MYLFSEIVLGTFNALVVLLLVVAVIVLVPVFVQLGLEEIRLKQKGAKKRRHRYGMANANDLAQKFLAERRLRETDEYKLFHPAIAGKRA